MFINTFYKFPSTWCTRWSYWWKLYVFTEFWVDSWCYLRTRDTMWYIQIPHVPQRAAWVSQTLPITIYQPLQTFRGMLRVLPCFSFCSLREILFMFWSN